jgi:hypothetical protein
MFVLYLYDFAFSFSNDILIFVWLIGYMSYLCLPLFLFA